MRNSLLFVLGLFLFGIVFSMISASAIEIQLLCLNQAQTVQFSKCNPVMSDRTCSSAFGCQYCVTYNEQNGVYCPANINVCNAQPGISCSNLVGNPGGNSSDNGNNQTNNQNNTSNNPPPRTVKADVAYIVKNELGVDNFLLDELKADGYSYEVIYEPKVKDTDFSNYYILIVGDQRLNDPAAIPVDKYKSIIINSYDYFKSGLDSQLGWSGLASSTSSPSSLNVKDSIDPLVAGIPKMFSAYNVKDINVKTSILKGAKPTGINIVVYAGSLSSDGVVASVTSGTKYLNGKVAQERSIFFGITKAQFWTSETKRLFKNSLNWLISGADLDGDGFLSDQDCNDRDPNINPAAQDPALNCVNDPPVFSKIPELTFSKGDLVIIPVEVKDPENDPLTYKIDDSRFKFSESDKTFSWQTSKKDAGDYTLKITVSDGRASVSQNVMLNVKNSLFKFTQIPDITWDEDNAYILNLSNYLSNPENDKITFGIGDTSSDNNLAADILSPGVFKFTPTADWFGEDWIVFSASNGVENAFSNKVILKVNPVNDAPRIKSSSPDSDFIKVIQDQEKTFSLNVEDPDKDNVSISWLLNNVPDGYGANYIFKKPAGVYNLRAVVSDSVYQIEKFWSIVVGASGEFTCSELSGVICTEKQTCPDGKSVNSLDTASCCLVACNSPPKEFKSISTCNKLNDSLKIDIISPGSGDKIKIGDAISTDVAFQRDVDENLNLDVKVFLYDLNKDKSVDDNRGSLDLTRGERASMTLDLTVPEEIDLNHDYALVVKAEDSGICNQKYQDFLIERPTDKVVISSFDVPEKAVCGETIKSKIKLENIGKNDEEISLEIKNSVLNINEKLEQLKVRKEGNSLSREFSWHIPEKIKSGDYVVTANVRGIFNGADSRKIKIECENESIPVESKDLGIVGPIKIDNSTIGQSIQQNKPVENDNSYIFIISIMLLVTFVSIAFLFFCFNLRRHRKN